MKCNCLKHVSMIIDGDRQTMRCGKCNGTITKLDDVRLSRRIVIEVKYIESEPRIRRIDVLRKGLGLMV